MNPPPQQVLGYPSPSFPHFLGYVMLCYYTAFPFSMASPRPSCCWLLRWPCQRSNTHFGTPRVSPMAWSPILGEPQPQWSHLVMTNSSPWFVDGPNRFLDGLPNLYSKYSNVIISPLPTDKTESALPKKASRLGCFGNSCRSTIQRSTWHLAVCASARVFEQAQPKKRGHLLDWCSIRPIPKVQTKDEQGRAGPLLEA